MMAHRPSPPTDPREVRAARIGAVGVLAVGVLAAAVSLAALVAFWAVGRPSWQVVASGTPAQAADLLLVVLCAAGVGVTAWLGCGLVLSVLGALPGAAGVAASAVARRLAPAAVRRAAALLVGAVLAATALPAAQAADAPPAPTTTWGTGAGSPSGHLGSTSDHLGSRSPLVPVPDPAFTMTSTSRTAATGAQEPWATTTAPDNTAQNGGTDETRSRTGTEVSIDGRAPDPNRTAQPGSPGSGPSVGQAPAVDPGFGPTGPDLPSPTATAPTTTAPVTTPTAPTGTAPAPARPGAPTPSSLGPLGQARPTTGDRHTSVTVMRGDSLWAIAERHLGPQASNAQIAHEWPRWYAANRSVIGEDPDIILVGQVLTAPAPTTNGAAR